jgi:hypothetical protein
MKPALFDDTERSMDISFDGRSEVNLTRNYYHDLNGYLSSDMRENTKISANHSHIYIEGAMVAGTQITLRQGIVSVRSLGDNAEITGGILLIISDEQLSQMSKNVRHRSNNYPTILVVPEAERARAFDILTEKIGHCPECPVEQLQEYLTENPKIPVRIIPGNATVARLITEAGLRLAGQGRG